MSAQDLRKAAGYREAFLAFLKRALSEASRNYESQSKLLLKAEAARDHLLELLKKKESLLLKAEAALAAANQRGDELRDAVRAHNPVCPDEGNIPPLFRTLRIRLADYDAKRARDATSLEGVR